MATTFDQLRELLKRPVIFEEYLAPAQFQFDADVDQEEQELLVSQLAAKDALELPSTSLPEVSGKRLGLVIAADLEDAQLNAAAVTLDFTQVAALFSTEDGEELSWYGADEIAHQVTQWAK